MIQYFVFLALTVRMSDLCLYVCLSMYFMLRRAVEEFLKHSKESTGGARARECSRKSSSKQASRPTGRQTGKQLSKQASRQTVQKASKQVSKQALKSIQLEPCSVGACFEISISDQKMKKDIHKSN